MLAITPGVTMKSLKLKKDEERRLIAGHLWIFSNEVDTKANALKTYEPGELVSVESSRGDFLGTAYVNPHSLITGRVCSRKRNKLIDINWLRSNIQKAAMLRDSIYSEPYYRLVHGEGDYLPGLVIDRYNDILVVQINTAGMELFRNDIVSVLVELFEAKTVLLRNDSSVRRLEGLDLYTEVAYGEMPDEVQLCENGLTYKVSLEFGQKTGWFYDHRENRALLQRLSSGKRVLDVFSYLGGWGLNAAAGGATKVVAVDASRAALDLAEENAKLNGFEDLFSTLLGDAVEVMRTLINDGEKFDIVVLDPPAFIKRKKDHRAGLQQYELISRLGAALLDDNGLLVTASCSQHLLPKELKNAALKGARKTRRNLQIFSQGGQGPDHPVNGAMPESDYLKAIFSRLISV